jgi:hypothetical protein
MSEEEKKLQATRQENAELERQVKEKEEEIKVQQEAARKQSEKEKNFTTTPLNKTLWQTNV